MRILTHVSVDLDAVASIWAVFRFVAPDAELVFVPADSKQQLKENDIAVDLSFGIKGEKSAFSKVIEIYLNDYDREIIRELADYIDQVDTGQSSSSKFDLNYVFRAIQSVLRDDFAVTNYMLTVFDGLYQVSLSKRKAIAEAEKAIWYGDIAFIENAKEKGTNGVLFERGAKFVIYKSGMNLGIIRSGDTDLNKLKQYIDEDGWFFHPSGFLAARGTFKAPSNSESKYSVDDLVRFINLIR